MELFKQIPLYRFLGLCNESSIEKTVLDCGAGGETPPLSLFANYGYTTYGIEMNAEQIKKANQFAEGRKEPEFKHTTRGYETIINERRVSKFCLFV